MTRETMTEHPRDARSTESECKRAIKKLEQVVLEGLRHGYFECSVACEIIKGQKRRLVITAGKSHQFVIRPEELDGST